MKNLKIIKPSITILFIIIVILLVTNGYAADHFGEYLNEQAPSKYSEATGWRKIVGYIMLFAVLVFMARQIWKESRK